MQSDQNQIARPEDSKMLVVQNPSQNPTDDTNNSVQNTQESQGNENYTNRKMGRKRSSRHQKKKQPN